MWVELMMGFSLLLQKKGRFLVETVGTVVA